MNRFIIPLTIANTTNLNGLTQFQKLVFLTHQELNGPNPYHFYPGQYGPYSAQLTDDLNELTDRDLLHKITNGTFETDRTYSITDDGTAIAADLANHNGFAYNYDNFTSLVDYYTSIPLFDLLDYIHYHYADLCTESKLHTPIRSPPTYELPTDRLSTQPVSQHTAP